MTFSRHTILTAALAALLTATDWAAMAAPATPAAPTTPAKSGAANTAFGEFAIHHYTQIRTRFGPKITVDLTGPHLSITSPRYDMAAPNIHLELGKGGVPPRYKATESVATGGVRIVARDPAAHRTTTLTCDHATYHATANPKDRGHIDMEGHVHSETVDPALIGPAVQDSERGTLTFVDENTSELVLENGDIDATVIEPKREEKTPKGTDKKAAK